MPQSQSDMILDSITIDNIDEAMYFYSYILEKIIKKEINRLKLLETDSDECSESESD